MSSFISGCSKCSATLLEYFLILNSHIGLEFRYTLYQHCYRNFSHISFTHAAAHLITVTNIRKTFIHIQTVYHFDHLSGRHPCQHSSEFTQNKQFNTPEINTRSWVNSRHYSTSPDYSSSEFDLPQIVDRGALTSELPGPCLSIFAAGGSSSS